MIMPFQHIEVKYFVFTDSLQILRRSVDLAAEIDYIFFSIGNEKDYSRDQLKVGVGPHS